MGFWIGDFFGRLWWMDGWMDELVGVLGVWVGWG